MSGFCDTARAKSVGRHQYEWAESAILHALTAIFDSFQSCVSLCDTFRTTLLLFVDVTPSYTHTTISANITHIRQSLKRKFKSSRSNYYGIRPVRNSFHQSSFLQSKKYCQATLCWNALIPNFDSGSRIIVRQLLGYCMLRSFTYVFCFREEIFSLIFYKGSSLFINRETELHSVSRETVAKCALLINVFLKDGPIIQRNEFGSDFFSSGPNMCASRLWVTEWHWNHSIRSRGMK